MKTTPISTPHAGLRAGKPAILAMALLLSCLAGMGARRADAAGYTWDAVTPSGTITDGTGTWNTTNANWFASGTTTQWVNGSDAQFGITGNAPAGSATTLTLGTNITVADLFVSNDGKLGQVTINSVAGSGTLTISGSVSSGDGNGTLITGPVFITNATGLVDASSVTIGGVATPGNGSTITMSGSVNVGGSGAVTVATNGNGGLTLSGTVAGATSLNVSNGTLTLSGTVLQDNTINVTGGTLLLSGTNAALGGAATISISNGTLDLSNANAVFASNYAATISQSGGTLKLKPGNVPTLTGTWGMTGGSLLISGSIFTGTIGTGANQLDISAGTLGVSATGTYSFNVGGTSAGGMLVWGSTAGFNLGTSAFNLESADNTMTFANSIDFNGGTRTIQDNAPNNNGSLLILSGTLQNSGTGNLVIQDSVNRNQGDTWVDLTGANTYTGTTFISGSTGNNNPMRIILGSSGSYSSASYDITGTTGGQLQIMPGNSGTTYVSGNIITPTGTDNTALHFTNDAGYTVVIGGTGTVNSLVSSGAGVTVLTGANTYTGSTLIKSGTLQIGNGGAAGSLPAATGINSLANTALVYDVSSTGTLTGTLTGSMSFTQEGSGLIALANAETYTGPTNITSGTLQLGNGTTDGSLTSGTINNAGTLVFNTNGSQNYAGQLSGNGTVTMSGSGNQKLSGANNYTGPTNVNAGTLQLGSTTALGSTSTLTVSGSATLNLSNGVSTQITTMSGTGQSLVLNNGAVLNFGVGNATADQLNLSGTTTVTGTTYIDLGLVSGTGVSNFTIISDSNPFVLNGGTFVLGTLPSLTSGSLTVTGSTVSVTYSGVSTVYWKGTGTGEAGYWSDYTNFTSNPAATGTLNAQFGSAQDVVFSGSGAVNQTLNFLDYNAFAHSLTINDPAGVDISTFGSFTLTLAGVTGNTGITVGSAAGALPDEIDANVNFTGTPNITVNNTGGLTITGIISSNNGLIVNGTGILTLEGGNNYTGGTQLVSGTLDIISDNNLGQNVAGNGVTFSGTTNATLQSLTNGLATSRAFVFSSGTGTIDPGPAGNAMTISGAVSGTGAFNVIDTGQLVLSGSDNYTGTATVSSGTLTITDVPTLAATGVSAYIVQAGATLQIAPTTFLDWEVANTITFSGSGDIDFVPRPNTNLQVHNSNVNLSGTGGTIEVASGTLENGGPSGFNGIVWTNNKDSLQIDSGAIFDTWDGQAPLVDALNGLGTLTRLGFGTGASTVTIGDNNGSGTFSGTITNQLGTINIAKEGTGTEVFTGTNGYAGSTTVNGGGTLRITNSTALGFGGQTFLSTGGQHTASVSGGSTLDINGGITLNEAVTLSGGSLINSGSGTTSILDSGIAGITFNSDNATSSSGPNSISVTFTGGSGTNAAAMAGTVAGGSNLYVQMTSGSAGTGYTPGNAPTVTLGGSVGGTVTAVVSSLALTGTGNTLGGNGNLTVNAQISGTGGFAEIGSGSLTLSAANIYTGTTTIAQGNLITANTNGSATGTGPVNITPNNSASATLSGTGIVSGLVTANTGAGSNIAHVSPGLAGTIGTLTLGSGLTLTAGTNLDFTLSSSSVTAGAGVNDLISLNGGNLTLPSSSGTITVNFAFTTSAPVIGSAYTLIGAAASINNFNAADFIATGTDGDTPAFSVSGSNLQVTFASSGGTTPTTYTLVATPATSRVIQGTGTTGVQSVITNTGTSPNDSLAYTNLGAASAVNGSVAGSTTTGTLALTQSATNTTTYTAGATTGTDVISPTATGTNATLGTAAAGTVTSGTVDVVANRVISASTVNYGDVLENVARTGTTNISTTGNDANFTRVTLTNASASNGTATVNTGTGAVLFNSSSVATTRTVTGTFGASGVASGTVSTLAVTGEGLNSEVDTAPTVAYTANVYQAFSGSTSVTANTGTSATLALTNLAPTDGGTNGQRAGVTITGYNTSNGNFTVTTDNGGAVGNSTFGSGNVTQSDVGTVSVASNALSGTYNYAGNINAAVQYTDTALQSQGTPAVPGWNGVTLSATVRATGTYGQTNQAAIATGGSFTGYGFTSSSGSQTTAVLLNGTASAPTTLTMKFTAHGSLSEPTSPYQSSDTLTLGGLNPTGGTGPDGGSTTTDAFVLQMSVSTNPNVINNAYYIGWYDPSFGEWVNAIAGNRNAVLPRDYFGGTAAYFTGAGGGNPAGSYAAYLAANGYTIDTSLAMELGAYGYDATDKVAWAVLDYDSDVEVIPEPATYAMIFSGFGMLIGFQGFRKRSKRIKE